MPLSPIIMKMKAGMTPLNAAAAAAAACGAAALACTWRRRAPGRGAGAGEMLHRAGAVTVRRAAAGDCATILAFIRELAEFEKCSDEVRTDEAALRAGAFPESGTADFYALIAEVDGTPAGFAMGSWTGRGCYLDDLYVTPAHRGRHLGTLLLRCFVADMRRRGCRRVQWHALEWNTNAAGFYARIGARERTEGGARLTNFVMGAAGMDACAAELRGGRR
eukprot:gene13738-7627_t